MNQHDGISRLDGAAAWPLALVLTHLSRILEIPADRVDPDMDMVSQDLTSVQGIELMDDLSADLGIDLEPAAVFDYSTPAGLAGFLAEQLLDATDRRELTETLTARDQMTQVSRLADPRSRRGRV
jgi:acyl carrier protein